MKTNRQYGFTLIEIMLTLLIATIVVGGAILLTISQAKFHQSQWQHMEATHALRKGLSQFRKHIPMTGFGIPRDMAFDLNFTDDAGGCNNSDRISIRYRHPIGWWMTSSLNVGVSGAALSISDLPSDTALDPSWPLGQMLFIYQSSVLYFMDRFQARSTGSTGFSLITANNQLLNINTELDVQFYRVNTYTFYIDCTVPEEPYLMLDQGLDLNGDATIDGMDTIPIAKWVSDMQVSYYLDTNNNGLLDDAAYNGINNPLTATDIGTNINDWANVKAIRVIFTTRKARQQVTSTEGGITREVVTFPISETFVLRNLNTEFGPIGTNHANAYEHISPNRL